MTEATPDPLDALLHPAGLHNDAHYLRAVTQMADDQDVVVGESIYSESGIKLLDKGARIDSSLYERLLQHKLNGSIDEQLLASDAVDAAAVEALVMQLCASHALGRQLVAHMGDQSYLLMAVLRHMRWPAAASFKMTVMRSQRYELYEHSVLMMMTAVFLASQQGMSMQDSADVAAGALLHDVGMLFMPPGWANAAHKLTPQERKHLTAHSITGMMVVRSAKVYPRSVEDAVMEHHERLDGTGYPRHLKSEEISPMGCILMLAEVVAAFYSKFQDMPAQRLSLVLRMNHNRFDKQLTEFVHALLSQAMSEPLPCGEHNSAQVRQVIATLGAVFQHWLVCKRKFPEKWQTLPGGRSGVYVDSRLLALEKSLAESGSHPRQQADWLTMFEQDPASMTELVLINREALWQIENCVQTCTRRWPQVLQPKNTFDEAMRDWLQSCRDVLKGASPTPPSANEQASVLALDSAGTDALTTGEQ